jgi:uncharacterized protein YraI
MKYRKILFPILLTVIILACNLPAPTAVVITATPGTVTATPTLPPATFTPIGSTVPFATPNDGPLNCRSGPGTNYQVLVVLGGTQSAEVVGKNPEGTWWYVKNPYLAGTFCWVINIYVNVTGDTSKTAVVGVPATPTNAASAVIAVDMTITPDTINAEECSGTAEEMTVTAKIQVNGPMQLKVHFVDELVGDLGTQRVDFASAGTQDVSDIFTPQLVDGRHRIFLEIEGLDLSDLNARKPYQINC